MSRVELLGAVKRGDVEAVADLVTKLKARSQDFKVVRGNILHFAVQAESDQVLKLLLDADGPGIDVNSKNLHGQTPLHCLALNTKSSAKVVVKLGRDLLTRGADLNARDNKGNTPLHLAAEYGNENIFEFLLDSGADVATRNNNGWTPLHSLARNKQSSGKLDLAACLIKRGSDVNAKDDGSEDTPLHLAAKCRNEKIFRQLLSSGAAVDARNNQGYTPLHCLSLEALNDDSSAHAKKSSVVAALAADLLKRGADVNAKDHFDRSPVYYAMSYANVVLIDLFSKFGAELSSSFSSEATVGK